MVFKWLDFKISNRCNNNCRYCCNQDPPEYEEKLSSESISNTIRDAVQLNFTHFAFLGGEPSIRENVDQLFTPLHEHDKEVQSVMAITNMHVFNANLYRAIYQSKAIHAQIVASIDSLKEPNYKNQKTAQTIQYLDKILEISKQYLDFGIREVHVHTVISRENITDIYDHIKYFKSKNIEVSLAMVEPHEIIDVPVRYNQFTRNDIELIINQLERLDKEDDLNWANKVLLIYIINYILDDNLNRFDCTAGKSHVIIESDGYVYPCLTESYKRGLKYGNILNESFSTIYSKMIEFECKSEQKQTCWDHFLWTKLDNMGR